MMIKLLRVDSRLLHGQVATAWCNEVGTDCILVAGDHISDIAKTTMKMSKPAYAKLIFKSVDDSIAAIKSGVTDKYNLFILVENITDAYRIASSVDGVKDINIGRTHKNDAYEYLNNETCASDEQKKQMIELADKGIHVVLQMIPSTKAVDIRTVVKKQ